MNSNVVPSSLEIFNDFIVKDETGLIDVRGVVSKECYEAWLYSRGYKKPKFPKEAFRNVLTSHCRGNRGMKPFSPEVEAALLKILRKKEVWPCFKDSDKKIGLRCCKVKGYWETRQKAENSVQVSDTQVSRPAIPFFLGSLYEHNQKMYNDQDGLATQDSKKRFGTRRKKTGRLTTSEIKQIEDITKRLLKSKESLLRELMEVTVHRTSGSSAPLGLISLYREHALKYLFPLKSIRPADFDDDMKFLCSRDFVLPPQAEQRFSPGKPIGCVYGDTVTATIIDEDHQSREIYGGSIIGTLSLTRRVNKIQAVMHLKEMHATFWKHREVWARSVEYRNDGTVAVFLNRYFTKDSDPPHLCYTQFQDVTDQFPQRMSQDM